MSYQLQKHSAASPLPCRGGGRGGGSALLSMKKPVIYLVSLLLFSCTNDSYEKGEGKYSLMEAELVELTIDSEKQGTAFVTDDGNRFTLTPPASASWIETADTVYRAALYFNRLSNTTAEPIAVGAVPTLRPREHWKIEQQKQDPLGVESAWVSKNGKYVNLGLLLKTGVEDDSDAVHTIGLAQDTVLIHADNSRTAVYRLLHDQGGVPRYYTIRRYASILLPDTARIDTVRLIVTTDDGTLTRLFAVKH